MMCLCISTPSLVHLFGTLHFLDLYVYFLQQLREVFSHYFLKNILNLLHSLLLYLYPYFVSIDTLDFVPEVKLSLFY